MAMRQRRLKSEFGIGVVHPRSVTEIALIKSTVLTCEKKLYPYDFRGSAKVIRYSV